MNWLFVTLTVFIVIASILLVIVVLLQNGKDGGLASNFVAGNQTFGVRQTADMLEKITWGLVTFILVVSIIASFSTGTQITSGDVTDKIENAASEQPEFPSAPVQGAVEAPATEVPSAEVPATEAPATETPAK